MLSYEIEVDIIYLYEDIIDKYNEKIILSEYECELSMGETKIPSVVSNNYIKKKNLNKDIVFIFIIKYWDDWHSFIYHNLSIKSFSSFRHSSIKIFDNIMILRRDDKMEDFDIPPNITLLHINSLSKKQYIKLSNGFPDHIKTIGYFGDLTYNFNNLPIQLKNFYVKIYEISNTNDLYDSYSNSFLQLLKLPYQCKLTTIPS